MIIRHVSLDVWNTIIRSNPAYVAERAAYLSEVSGLPQAEVKEAYRSLKERTDAKAEEFGTAPKTDELFRSLMHVLHVPGPNVVSTAKVVRQHVERLFLANPPAITPEARELIGWLRARNVTVSIGSNSNFISGTVMHGFLNRELRAQLHGQNPFRWGTYSDMIGHSKPIRPFFDAVWDSARTLIPGVSRYEILHAGDNAVCDVRGPTEAGMHGLLVPVPEALFDVVIHHLQEHNHA